MKKLILFLFLLIGTTFGCKKDSKYTLIKINSYTEKCQGVSEMNCLLVQMGSDIGTDNWTYFYDAIEGFQYEEGYVYQLQVLKHQIGNPPADGSSVRYVLVNLISKTKATE